MAPKAFSALPPRIFIVFAFSTACGAGAAPLSTILPRLPPTVGTFIDLISYVLKSLFEGNGVNGQQIPYNLTLF